jgi:acyl-CoA dehydrogenase
MPEGMGSRAREAEHDYPFEPWDKLTAAGFHGVGVLEDYGGQAGDVVQMILARELAGLLGGLAWIWGNGEHFICRREQRWSVR